MASENVVTIGAGHGLLPDGNHNLGQCLPIINDMFSFRMRVNSHEMLKTAILNLSLKSVDLKSKLHQPHANK